jgi:hypothetical protein
LRLCARSLSLRELRAKSREHGSYGWCRSRFGIRTGSFSPLGLCSFLGSDPTALRCGLHSFAALPLRKGVQRLGSDCQRSRVIQEIMRSYIGYLSRKIESTRKSSGAELAGHQRCSQRPGSRGYGGVIRRTGTGELPEPPITGLAALLVELQPATLRTVILMSPGVVPGVAPD